MGKCKFCEREILNGGGLWMHQKYCKFNPDRIRACPSQFAAYKDYCKLNNIKSKNQFIKSRELGIDPPKISDETRKKISNNSKNRVWTDDQKRRQSNSMINAVKKHPESYSSNNVCGRNKQIIYNGVKFNSTWELITVKWFDLHNVKWQRNNIGFEYFWNKSGKNHIYYPDFYLVDFDCYLEVKGYETERDHDKWKVVDNLIIFRKKEIDLINLELLNMGL